MTFSAEKTLRDIAVLLAGDDAGGQSSAEHALATIRTAIANAGGGAAKTLADLTDVALASPADGDGLAYDQATSKWINRSAKGAASAPAAVSVTDAATLILAANPSRVSALLDNTGAADLYVGATNTVTPATGVLVSVGGTFLDTSTRGTWYGIVASGTADVRVIEVA